MISDNSKRDEVRMTPMMQQYWEAKQKHPGMILLFRMGDFFECFEEDAELIARVLGVQLTSRDGNIPMAGVPAKAVDVYLQKLLHAGHRVAVCDQVEDASQAKGLVRREVTRIVTPGTVTEDELLDPVRPNLLVALVPTKGLYGLAWVEATTGDLVAMDVAAERVGDELARLSPAELILPENQFDSLPERIRASLPSSVTRRPDWTFEPQSARSFLKERFGVMTVTGFGFDDQQPAVTAAGALLAYLKETLKASLAHIRPLRPYNPSKHLILDETTRRSLELIRTLREGERQGSLLSIIDRTVTSMGARCLHEALLAPLGEIAAIEGRLDAVEEWVNDPAFRNELRELLGEIFDLQRLAARASTARANPRDLAAIAKTLRQLPRIKAKIAGRKSSLIQHLERQLDLCPDLRELLDRALADEPPTVVKEGGVIREGYSPELDELRGLAREGNEWLARYQAQEITRTGIPNLKVGYNQVHGYFIEVTNSHAAKVPPDYQRRQTLKGAERYITTELKEYEEKVLTAREKALALEASLFDRLREDVAAFTDRILGTAQVLAHLDFLAGLAELASQRRYVRPMMSEAPVLEIRDGRHPVLDQTLPSGTFVPNDVILSPETGRFWLITGPNMAGKSVLIKQAALITLLAHIGSFVPARSAKIGLTDRIFTRVGASDELQRGLSTFMVEMTEAANILNNATAKSLVILDEIGRGTSTYDGVSLAWSISEYLHDEIGCRAMFATHYHELAQLAESLNGLRNYHVQVRELDNEVIFLHKLAPGSAERSYGIHVARLAGIPKPILERAQHILTELEARHQLPHTKTGPLVLPPEKSKRPKKTKPEDSGPSLFSNPDS